MEKKTLHEVDHMLRRYPMLQNKQSRRLRLWREAIEDTLAEYEAAGETEKTAILTQHFFDGASNEEMLQSLPLGRRTYYDYKCDILCTAAFYAAKRRAL